MKNILKIIFLIASIMIFSFIFIGIGSLLMYGKLFFKTEWENSTLVMLFGTIGQLLAAIVFTKIILKKPLNYIFIKRESILKNIILGLFIGFLQISFFVGFGIIFNALSFDSINIVNLNLIFVAYFVLFFIQSTSEELLTRGILTRVLLDKFGRCFAIFVPSIIFGLLHFANEGASLISTINTILVGLFFAKLLFYTENIMLVSGVHAGWNFSMAMIYGLPVSGFNGFNSLLNFRILNSNICDKIYGPEASFIVTIIEIISILIIVYLERKKERLNG